jgi:hypothetical protein
VVVEAEPGGRALTPRGLPRDAELLIPIDIAEDVYNKLRASGYQARRAALLLIDESISATEAVRSAVQKGVLVIITSRTLARLAAEHGGLEEAWSWLSLQADSFNQPLAVSVMGLHANRGTIAILSPTKWTGDKLAGWVATHIEEVEAIFGPAKLRDAVAPKEVLTKKVRRTRSLRQLADSELDDVTDRLALHLRQIRPNLFTARGTLRHGALAELVRERTGHKSHLTRAEILKLIRPDQGAADAP